MEEWTYAKKKKLGGRKISPYIRWKTSSMKKLLCFQRGWEEFIPNQDAVKKAHIKVSWAIFSGKGPFSDQWNDISPGLPVAYWGGCCWLHSFLWGSSICKSLAARQRRAVCPASPAPKPGRASPAASARNGQNWHMPSGQSSHRKVDSLNGKIKACKQDLTFQTAFSIGEKSEGEKKKTHTKPHQTTNQKHNLHFLLEKREGKKYEK